MVAYVITVVAGIASYPLDTIRRRLMMQAGTVFIKHLSFIIIQLG
jgi:hypothetical protein